MIFSSRRFRRSLVFLGVFVLLVTVAKAYPLPSGANITNIAHDQHALLIQKAYQQRQGRNSVRTRLTDTRPSERRQLLGRAQVDVVKRTSKVQNLLVPRDMVHDFKDIVPGSQYDADMMRMHSLGLFQTVNHAVRPRGVITWSELLTAAVRGQHLSEAQVPALKHKLSETMDINFSAAPTRGEVLQVLAAGFLLEELPIRVRPSYADIPFGHPLEEVIAAAKHHGWLTNLPKRIYRPNQPMSRVEFASVFIHAFAYAEAKRKPAVDVQERMLTQGRIRSAKRVSPRAFEDVTEAERHLRTRVYDDLGPRYYNATPTTPLPVRLVRPAKTKVDAATGEVTELRSSAPRIMSPVPSGLKIDIRHGLTPSRPAVNTIVK